MKSPTEELPKREIWKDVVGYEGLYVVSSLGRVKSIRFNKMLVQSEGYGHSLVGLSVKGKPTTQIVHRLVAKAFIPNPENKPYVRHLDFNNGNNNVSNLEWGTPSTTIKKQSKSYQQGYEEGVRASDSWGTIYDLAKKDIEKGTE